MAGENDQKPSGVEQKPAPPPDLGELEYEVSIRKQAEDVETKQQR